MSHELKISNDLWLPSDAATQTFAFIARKGAGKSYAAGKLAECLLDNGVQVVVLDAVGNWYGLRLLADGKTPGYDVPVIGGLRGDIPLEATAGHLIADIVVDSGRSLVIDVSQFSKHDRQKFATGFAERLWLKKKGERHPSPVHLIIEESQLIVPEAVKGDSAVMVGIYEEIIRLGRNYGIGVSMISQRPQSVNKEVLNQTECLFVLQVNGAHERKALTDWVTFHGVEKGLVSELPGLPIGTAYVWSPQWLNILKKVKIGTKKTFDSTATPRAGSHQTRRDLKPLNLDDLKERMAATIERAKADDPKELRKKNAEAQKRIAELERQLAKPQPKATQSEPKIVEKKVVIEATMARLEKLVEKANKLEESLRDTSTQITAVSAEAAGMLYDARKINEAISEPSKALAVFNPGFATETLPVGRGPLKGPVSFKVTALRETTGATSIPSVNGDVKLSKKQQEILNALAWYESIGIEEPSTLQVGAVALIDASGGHFSNVVGPLSSQGLVERGSGAMKLTDKGRSVAVLPEQVGSLDDYHNVLRARVRKVRSAGGRTIDILNVIISHGGRDVTTEQIGQMTGIDHTGGHFSNVIGPLSTVGLIERRSGVVRPTEILFPPGLS